jgi:four helix bundle protein
MGEINDFDDFLAWNSARDLAVRIELLVQNGVFGNNNSLKAQIRSCSISVASNIAEGFGRGGNREFINFLSIARGSLAEVKCQILLAYEFGYLEKDDFSEIIMIVGRTGRLIGGLIKYLKASKVAGSKYKAGGGK